VCRPSDFGCSATMSVSRGTREGPKRSASACRAQRDARR